MALIVTEECILCGACEPECPNEAITEGDELFEIDHEKCTECVGAFDEPQCVGVCPTDSIIPDPDRRESQDQLMEKYNALHA